jgi:serine/threonine-protein kinase RsbW
MDQFNIEIKNDIAELPRINEFLDGLTEKWRLPRKLSLNINLVMEEVITNIIFYGIEDDEVHFINIGVRRDAEGISITVTDDGKPFDIRNASVFTDRDKDAGEREVGGLGIHFVRSLMDKITYTRSEGKNILTLFKANDTIA